MNLYNFSKPVSGKFSGSFYHPRFARNNYSAFTKEWGDVVGVDRVKNTGSKIGNRRAKSTTTTASRKLATTTVRKLNKVKSTKPSGLLKTTRSKDNTSPHSVGSIQNELYMTDCGNDNTLQDIAAASTLMNISPNAMMTSPSNFYAEVSPTEFFNNQRMISPIVLTGVGGMNLRRRSEIGLISHMPPPRPPLTASSFCLQ